MSRSSLRLRRVSVDDLLELDAVLPPEWRIREPAGWVAERNGRVVAAGTVSWDEWGRAWGWFNRREPVPAVTMHRRAIEMLRLLREVGEPALYAICHVETPGAEKWLKRLGFVPDATLTHELGPVYRCDLSN